MRIGPASMPTLLRLAHGPGGFHYWTLLAKPLVIASPEPPGDEVAGLQSFRPINRAREPRLRGGNSVAGALYAPAGIDLDSSQPVAAKSVRWQMVDTRAFRRQVDSATRHPPARGTPSLPAEALGTHLWTTRLAMVRGEVMDRAARPAVRARRLVQITPMVAPSLSPAGKRALRRRR